MLGFQRVEKLEIDTQGDLVLHTVVGPIHQRKPVIYQEVEGVRKEIPGGYVLKGEHQVSFKVAAYDASALPDPEQPSLDAMQALEARFCDEHELADLHSGFLIGRDHVRLHDAGHSRL